MAATPNFLAYIALLLWFPITFALFARLRPEVATGVGLLGGKLFLPERTYINLPIFPDLGKDTVPTLAVFLGCMYVARQRLVAAKPFRGMDGRLLALLLVGDIGTWLTNSDVVFARPQLRPGLTAYDTITSLFYDTIVVYLTFFLGRAMFRTARDLQTLLLIVFGLGLAYTPFCLIEMRLSPQLHNWIYGFAQQTFDETMRGGGYRPSVFLFHGIVLGRFMLIAVLSGLLLARAKLVDTRLKIALAFLAIVFVFCRSTGALILAVASVPLVLFASQKTLARSAVALAVVVALYPMMRGSEMFPVDDLVNWAGEVSPERAESLAARFNMEEILLARARERGVFGWGGYSRSRVYHPISGVDLSTPDGEWIITMGERGLVGFIGWYGLYLIPVIAAARSLRRLRSLQNQLLLAGLAIITVLLAVDTLPNSSSSLPHFFWSGALYGVAAGLPRQERLVRLRALQRRAA